MTSKRLNDPWLNWQALAAVAGFTLAVAVCFWLMWSIYHDEKGLTADGAFQGICTLVGAVAGISIIGWQVSRTFENERRHRKSERMRLFRDQLLPLREILLAMLDETDTKSKTMKDLLDEEGAAPQPFSKDFFDGFGKFNLASHRDTITLSEQYAFRARFDWFQAERWYLENAAWRLAASEQVARVRGFKKFIEVIIKEFDGAFPPD
jgi:hypothetical protein